MPRHTSEQLAADWLLLLSQFPPAVRQPLKALAERHAAGLAGHFYQQMLQDQAASQFLSHDQVKSRLNGAMQRWVVGVFAAETADEVAAVIAQQMQIGEIHARLDLPVHLVLRGARGLKQQFNTVLPLPEAGMATAEQLQAAQLLGSVIDLAMEIMSQAYSSSHDRSSRAQEAYRLFAVAQNVSTERERQRAALLDWENQLMFDHAVGLNATQLPRIGASEFGLWFRHKGAHAFQGTPETGVILQTMEQIDALLLPAFGPDEREAQVRRLRELREQTRNIAFHLDALFEQNNELEAGRDVLTRLLNRKFLPVVLGKEISYARERGSGFAVLAIDIDHFKKINDGHGHEAGDLVLQQLAALLSNHSRGGDYLFRLGGEEFLMLLVDVDARGALRAAEKLRQQVSQEAFRLPQERRLQVTVSIGLALFGGHPDYQRLLRSADAALYQAKHGGRNRVVVADDEAG